MAVVRGGCTWLHSGPGEGSMDDDAIPTHNFSTYLIFLISLRHHFASCLVAFSSDSIPMRISRSVISGVRNCAK